MDTTLTIPTDPALEREAVAALPDRVHALAIVDAASLALAGTLLRRIKTLRATIVQLFAPHISRAVAAHRALLKERRHLDDPLAMAEGILKHKIATFTIEDAERRAREARQRAVEAQDAHAARVWTEVEALEAAGAHDVAADLVADLVQRAPRRRCRRPTRHDRRRQHSGRVALRGDRPGAGAARLPHDRSSGARARRARAERRRSDSGCARLVRTHRRGAGARPMTARAPIGKPKPNVVIKRERRAQAERAARAVRAAVWRRDQGRCRACQRRRGQHIHHLQYRSRGGRWTTGELRAALRRVPSRGPRAHPRDHR